MQPLNLQEAILMLQKYLRAISYADSRIIRPPLDGIFDSDTERSVRSFQEVCGIEPSGLVDRATWEAIYEAYKAANAENAELQFFPSAPADYASELGEQSDFILVIQILLRELSAVYDSFEEVTPSGIFDAATKRAITELQRASGLAETGRLDKATYKRLLYDFSHHASF